jgi:hypothetical protein
MAKLAKIDSERWYTLAEIVEGGYLAAALAPWKATYPTVRKLVRDDRAGANVLRAAMRGRGTNVRYQIKGEFLIKFIK